MVSTSGSSMKVSCADPILDAINWSDRDLRQLSIKIHENPETCFEEVQAHDNITAFLEDKGFSVVQHAFGLETSLTAEYGQGGRLVTFCAEYDALPQIGHGCGHNLIATSSIAAFLGTAEWLRVSGQPGRVRLLGCPAEEGGAGKIALIKAGAFVGVDAALMIHPTPQFEDLPSTTSGVSYGTCLASSAFEGIFTGKPAHGAASPWVGTNAMDAVSLSYTAVGLKRQQMMPTDRVQINLHHGGTALNVIPERASVECCVRSKTANRRDELTLQVQNCLRGAAVATGCEVSIRSTMDSYADIRPNETLCREFTHHMRLSGQEYLCDLETRYFCSFGTDMGNVSYEVPSFHGTFTIPTELGTVLHSEEFTRAAKSPEAHVLALGVGKGMAVVGAKVLGNDIFASEMWQDFDRDRKLR